MTTPTGGGNGTDANIRFTLTGCKGTATATINSGFVIDPSYNSGRLENGNTDYVTIPSKDLGTLTTLTIYNDGTGFGPEWTFQDIKVSSAGYLNLDTDSTHEYKTSTGTPTTLGAFGQVTPPLTGPSGNSFSPPPLPDVTAQCSAPLPTAPVATESCNPTPITGTTTSAGPFGQGDYTITWSFTDSNNNTKTRTQGIHVHDTIFPQISCSPNIVVNATAPTGTAVPFTVTGTDNCSPVTISLGSGLRQYLRRRHDDGEQYGQGYRRQCHAVRFHRPRQGRYGTISGLAGGGERFQPGKQPAG